MVIDLEQAQAFYDSLGTHYATQEIDSTNYGTGDYIRNYELESNLHVVFPSLIDFFEKELGFTSPEEIRSQVIEKRNEYETQKQRAREAYQSEALSQCEATTLIPPSDETVKDKLRLKLADYRTRLEKNWGNMPPNLAFQTQPGYQLTYFKILIATILLGEKEVPLRELLASEFTTHSHLDANLFFEANEAVSLSCLPCPL